jgi:TPR repeat protein
MRWYGLAADQGFTRAQFSLGLMYANGLGVRQGLCQRAQVAEPGGNAGPCKLRKKQRHGRAGDDGRRSWPRPRSSPASGRRPLPR